jgi:hypothetical protein
MVRHVTPIKHLRPVRPLRLLRRVWHARNVRQVGPVKAHIDARYQDTILQVIAF